MMDSNEQFEDVKPLHRFMIDNNLIDAIGQLNPSWSEDKTYIDGSKRIDHIFISPDLAEIALKAGHHPIHQHFISDHKGIYIQFQAKDFFDDPSIDQTFYSFRGLQLNKQEAVEKYIEELERIYSDNKFIKRLHEVAIQIEEAETKEKRQEAMLKNWIGWIKKGQII